MDGPALQNGALSTIGINFDKWTETAGISCTDGAVFFMDPDHGATTEPAVVMQLTVPTGTPFEGSFSAQGRSTRDNGANPGNWQETAMSFNSANVGQSVKTGQAGQTGH